LQKGSLELSFSQLYRVLWREMKQEEGMLKDRFTRAASAERVFLLEREERESRGRISTAKCNARLQKAPIY
jgi:hypothetical protein